MIGSSSKSLERAHKDLSDESPQHNDRKKRSFRAQEEVALGEDPLRSSRLPKSQNKEKARRSNETLFSNRQASRASSFADSPMSKTIKVAEPEAFFDWHLKKNLIVTSEKRHHAHPRPPNNQWARLRSMRKTFKSKILQMEFQKLLEEKLKEDDLEEEEEKRRKDNEEDELVEDRWRREIQRDAHQDSYDLVMMESFEYKTIREKFRGSPGVGVERALAMMLLLKNMLMLSCKVIAKSKAFKFFSLILIGFSCFKIATRYRDGEEKDDFWILGFFLFEMLIKILAEGLFTFKKGYFSKGWNVYDFVMNLLSLLFLFVLKSTRMNFSAFRALRVLKVIKWGLFRTKLNALFSALPLIFSSLKIEIFFQVIITFIGMNLFSGLLKQRCIDPKSGKVTEAELVCGYKACEDGLICAKILFNPEWDTYSFDTFDSSLMQVIRVLGAENWNYALGLINRAASPYIFPYYLAIVTVGNYVLLHLILAVLKVNFSGRTPEQEGKSSRLATLNLRLLKSEGYRRETCFKAARNSKVRLFKTFSKKMSHLLTKYSSPRRRMGGAQHEVMDQYSPLRKKSVQERVNHVVTLKEKKKRFNPVAKEFLIMDLDSAFEKSPALLEINRNSRFLKKIKGSSQLMPEDVFFILRKLGISEEVLIAKIVEMKKTLFFFKVQVKKDHSFKSTSEEDVIDEVLRNERRQDEIANRLEKANQNFRMHYALDEANLKRLKEYENIKKTTPKPRLESGSSKLPLRSSEFKFSNQSPLKIWPETSSSPRNRRPRASVRSKSHRFTKKINTFFMAASSQVVWTYEQARKKINEEIENPQPLENSENAAPQEAFLFVLNEDTKQQIKGSHIWSGQDVVAPDAPSLRKTLKIFHALNFLNKEIWIKGVFGKLLYARKLLRAVVRSEFYRLFFRLLILFNVVSLSLRGILSDQEIQALNNSASILFSAEIVIRVSSLGLRKFVRYFLNLLDCLLLLYMIFDILLRKVYEEYDQPFVERGLGLRLFKSFDSILVFRIIHLLLEINYVHFLIGVIRKTLPNFLVVSIFYLFALLIYALFGMSLFQGRFDLSTLEGKEKNFETFWWSFVSALKLSIFDDSYVFVMLGAKEPGKLVSFLYVLSGVFILHFVMLKLFCAVMLDGFEVNTRQEIEEEDEEEAGISNLERSFNSPQSPASPKKFALAFPSPSLPDGLERKEEEWFSPLNNDSPRRLTSRLRGEELNMNQSPMNQSRAQSVFFQMSGPAKPMKESSVKLNLAQHRIFVKVPPGKSLLMFSKNATVRKLLFKLILNPYFILLSRMMILLSCVNLSFETFVDDDNYNFLRLFSKNLNTIINFFFTIETCVNIIIYGFILEKGAYMRDLLNVMDMAASVSFVLDYYTDDQTFPIFRVKLFCLILN